ncbi:MAG TPA: glycosyltransferase, partial [Bacilli bacterium]
MKKRRRFSARRLRLNTGRVKGWEDGHRKGWTYGYYKGQCAAVMQNIPPPDSSQLFDIRVLYVSAGIGVPYLAIDQSVIEGFTGLVREIAAILPGDHVVPYAAEFQPDLVVVLNGLNFSVEHVGAIRAMGIKTAIWFVDDPYYTDWTESIAPHYDYVFTLELSCVAFYQELGCQLVHYLPLGVNPGLFYPKRSDTSFHREICFIGVAYVNRVQLFDQVAAFLAKKELLISGWWWDRLSHYSLLAKQIQLGTWLSSEETASYYNGGRIVLNNHRSHDDESYNKNSRKLPALSVNPRTFEIAGCGAFQLTDIRQDLGSYYVPGQEIATYSSAEELMDKISYYLDHEDERREIALAGLYRTMKDHTYRK